MRCRCQYCGDLATAVDHVPPVQFAEQLAEQPDVAWHAEVLQDLFHTRYDETLAIVRKIASDSLKRDTVTVWDEEELEELGRALRGRIEHALLKNRWAKNVIDFDAETFLENLRLLARRAALRDVNAVSDHRDDNAA